MSRRALLIGLGSSGCEVCNQLIERMAWEYGGTEVAKFVDFLGIETNAEGAATADSANSKPSNVQRLVDAGKMLHITLAQNDVHNLVNSPKSFDADIGLRSWFDDGVLEGRPDVRYGAGNERMLGRICLLYPSNLQNAYNRISMALSALNVVPSTVQVARGGENVTFELAEGISVYVVGTLCGGTASGACVDLGYLLRKIHEDSGINLELNALFAIPHGSWPVAANKANASAALTELNHYSSKWSMYRQKMSLPGERTELKIPGPPYDFTYLLSPRGLESTALDGLWVECAQYIWTDVFSEVGDTRKQKQTDFVSFKRTSDQLGLNQQFMTFGVSSIEYPATQVIKGCSYRLIGSALKRVCAIKEGGWDVKGDLASKLGLQPAKMRDNLLVVEGSPALPDVIRDRISRAAKEWGSTADLRKAEAELDVAFGMDSAVIPSGGLKADLIDETIKRNNPILQAAMINGLSSYIAQSLSEPRKGLAYCKAFLDEIERYVKRRQKEIEAADDDRRVEEAKRNKNHAIDQIELVLGDFITKMVLLEQSAVRHYTEDYRIWAEKYFLGRLGKKTRVAEIGILQGLIEPARRLRIRLDNLDSILQKAGQAAQVAYMDCRDQQPLVNGYCVFEAPTAQTKGTVDTQYERTLPDSAVEEKAMSQVLQGLGSLLQQVSQPLDQPGDLDIEAAVSRDGGNLPIGFLSHLETLASRIFSHVRDISIIDFLKANSENTKAIVAKAWDASALLVPVPAALIGFVNRATEPRKYYRLVFFRNAVMASAGSGNGNAVNVAVMLKGYVTADGAGRPGGWGDLEDPGRLVILREYGAIPLRAVPQLSTLAESEATYLTNTNSRTLSSRLDVHWMPRDEAEMKQYTETLQHILMGLACELITPLPGTVEYKFEAKGFSAEMPSSVPEAAAKLMHQPRFRKMVEQCVEKIAEQDGEAAVAQRIESFINDYRPTRWGGISKKNVIEQMHNYLKTHPNLDNVMKTMLNIREEWYKHLYRESDGLYHCCNEDCHQTWKTLEDITSECPACGDEIV